MTKLVDFAYADEEWGTIREIIIDQLASFLKVDQVVAEYTSERIRGKYGGGLQDLIQSAAGMYIERSTPGGVLNRRIAASQDRIDRLKALRGNAEGFRDNIVASYGIEMFGNGRNRASTLDAVNAYISGLTYQLDILENPISISEHHEPRSNAALAYRHDFWSELVELWTGIGGRPTGDRATEFLYEATRPVIAWLPDGTRGG
jgi:hypothetical protein